MTENFRGYKGDMKKKILIVGDSPFVDTGFANTARELGRIFHTNGYIVQHIGMWDPRPDKVIRSFGHYTFPYDVHICKPPFKKYAESEYKNILHQFKPNIVIIITDIWHAENFMIQDPNIYTIYLFHVEGEPLPKFTKAPEQGILDWVKTLLKVNKVIFGGPFGKKVALDRIAKDKKYVDIVKRLEKEWEVIGDGIDLNVFSPIKDKTNIKKDMWHLDNNAVVIGYFGRQNGRKCIPYALEAFAKWPDRPENVYFYCHCPIRDSAGWNLPDLINDLGIAHKVIVNVKLTEGKGVSEEVMNKLYNACDLTISTSLGEGFGQTACVGPGSMIKTTSGFKPIENIKPGDLVATQKGRYIPVSTMYKLPHEGKVFKVHTETTLPFIITTNERVLRHRDNYVNRRGYVDIADCKIGDYLKYPIVRSDANKEHKKELQRKRSIQSQDYNLILKCRDVLINGNKALYNTVCKIGKYYVLNIFKNNFRKALTRRTKKVTYDIRYIYNKITKISKIDYKGYVYTMNLEDDHMYTVNGATVVHNCQSLAAGTPVIVTNYSELSQFNKGTMMIEPSFYYVEVGTNIRRALVKIEDIIECYKKVYDKTYMDSLREQCVNGIKQFSWKNIEKEWLKLIGAIDCSKSKKRDTSTDLVSIVMPVYNSDIVLLKEAIDSVEYQTYGNIELILVDDGSEKKKLNAIISLVEDHHVKLLKLSKNTGIANATTEGIKIAKGKYVGFLDHDDLLKPTCVSETVEFLQKNTKNGMVYTDEEIVDKYRNNIQTVHKQDYNEQFLLSMMYINHFRLYKKDLLEEFLPLRYSGAQDYDLTLRFSERYKIGHIRNVLYSWRKSDTSSLMGINKEIINNNKSCVEDALKRRNINAEVKANTMETQWHIDRKLETNDLVSIIILTKEKLHLIEQCVNSIEKYTDYPYELIIVDTGSKEPATLDFLKKISEKHTVIYDDFQFSRSNNDAAKIAKGKYLLFLNNDTIATTKWLSELMKQAQRPEVGIVGPKLLFPNDTIQHAGVAMGVGGVAGHMYLGAPKNAIYTMFDLEVSAVTGACLLIRKDVFEKVGGFEERYMIEFQDIDLAMKVKALGYKTIYTPYSVLYHYCSLTRGNPSKQEAGNDRSLFTTRWYDIVTKLDPNILAEQIDPNNNKMVNAYKQLYPKMHQGRGPWEK